MVEHVLLLDGAEGAEADVKQHFDDLHAHALDLLQKFGREVKARRGSGRRARLAAVDRLIALGVLELLVDIRGEGHIADAGEDVLKRALIEEADDALTRLGDGEDFEGELIGEVQLCAGAALAAGAHEDLPLVELKAL